MKLFGKKSEEGKEVKDAEIVSSSSTTKKASTEKATKKESVKKDDKKSTKKTGKNADIAYGVILAPLVSEKSHAQTDLHVYSFQVHKKATKAEIKKAIEGLYEVTVERVNTVNMPVRRRTIGRNRGYQSAYKKALVKIGANDKIDFFEGV